MGCNPSISSTHSGERGCFQRKDCNAAPSTSFVDQWKKSSRVMNEARTRELPKLGMCRLRSLEEAPHLSTSFSGLGPPHIFHQPRLFLLPCTIRLLQWCLHPLGYLSPQPRVHGRRPTRYGVWGRMLAKVFSRSGPHCFPSGRWSSRSLTRLSGGDVLRFAET